MEWWHVYLFTRLDGLNVLFTMLTVICICAEAVFLGIWGFNADMSQFGGGHRGQTVAAKKNALRCSLVLAAVALIGVAIPSQKEAAAIYLLPKLAHSDFAKEAQQIPTDAAKLMRLKLEAWIADMEPKKEK